jgi:hypothetical protein
MGIFSSRNKKKTTSWFEESLEYRGIILEEPGYHIWGSSPIQDEKGNVHLFVARWPVSSKFDPGWRKHSEIAHYRAESPEGNFKFVSVVVKGTGGNSWDSQSAHNPTIHFIDEKYVLLYISNTGLEEHPANQCIGMMLATSLDGPWEKVGNDGKILGPPTDPSFWNYKPMNGVNNPAFIKHPLGKYYLYFKSAGYKMGVAMGDNLTGPYKQLKNPITSNLKTIEDGYVFFYQDKFYLCSTDNHGILLKGGLIIWESPDGINFDNPQIAARLIIDYLKAKGVKRSTIRKAKQHYGQGFKLERPQLLIHNNKPSYLYAPSSTNIKGGSGSVCYLFKIN